VVPLYAARLSDLAAGDVVIVECACGHAEALTARTLATAGVGADNRALDLPAPSRVRRAGARGMQVCQIIDTGLCIDHEDRAAGFLQSISRLQELGG
jgi:hypothetical protein